VHIVFTFEKTESPIIIAHEQKANQIAACLKEDFWQSCYLMLDQHIKFFNNRIAYNQLSDDPTFQCLLASNEKDTLKSMKYGVGV
jgi:hypothetical protein